MPADNLAVKVILTADGAQLVSGTRAAKSEIEGLKNAANDAGGATDNLAGASTRASAALGSVRGAASAAVAQIASVAGVSESAVASVGGLTSRFGAAGAAATGLVGVLAALVAGFAVAVNIADAYNERMDSLRGTIALAGQQGKITATSLTVDAQRIAGEAGQSYDDVLASLEGLIAGQKNTASESLQLAEAGAKLAATFELDVGKATDIVSEAFNALGEGEVRALEKNFGFLDQATKDNIITLAGLGFTAEAQQALLKALAATLHGEPGSVSTSFGNVTSAVADYIGQLLSSVPAIQEFGKFIDGLAVKVNNLAAELRGAAQAELASRPLQLDREIARLEQARDRELSNSALSRLTGRTSFDAAIARKRSERADAGARFAQEVAPGLRRVRGGSNSGFKPDPEAVDLAGQFEKFNKERKKLASGGATPRTRTPRKPGKSDEERAEEKAAREAKATARELANTLEALTRAYDPLDAAQRKYKETLADIAKLQSESAGASRISAEQAKLFADAAEQELGDAKFADLERISKAYDVLGGSAFTYAKALREIAALEARSIGDGGIAKFEADRLREAAKQQKIADDLGRLARARLEQAGTAGGEAFKRSGRAAAEDIALLFGDRIGGQANELLRLVGNKPGEFGSGLDELGDKLENLFEDVFGTDGPLAQGVGNAITSALQAAQFGKGVTDLFGARGSRTGAAVGSLAGKGLTAATGIPGLDAVGAAIGSFIGGALKKAKTGSSALTFDGGELSAGTAVGNSGARRKAATAATGDLAQRLSAIAETLGGVITGKAAVSIGFKNGKPVVDTDGLNRTKGAGVVKFGKDDTEGAFAFAAANAIADGVIGGLSDKVSAALRSSDDIERAIREAVKVDELESLLEGLAGGSAFRDFERQAKERLRIATQFGFDLVKVEAANAKERKSLIERSLDEAVGGLREILESFKNGDRATGSLIERRDALVAERNRLEATAATDSEAADKLARVIAAIDDISLEAFGTAGGQFAADRAANTSIAQRIVDQANAEITAAAAKAQAVAGTDSASTDALIKESNARIAAVEGGIDELNNQIATTVANGAKMIGLMQQLVQLNGVGDDLFAAARAIGASVLKS